MPDNFYEHIIKHQNDHIASLTNQLQRQSEQIHALTLPVAELNERLKKNSHNSSKPPSSDGLNKPKKPDELIDCEPDECLSCPNGTGHRERKK